jgi:hypothetical protein
MKEKVIIERNRNGYVIRSFDFTSSIFEPFEGVNSLARALRLAAEKGYNVINNGYGTKEEPTEAREIGTLA